MDNAQEFKSQQFEDYCTATGISLTYAVPYEHSQNGLAEAFIKKIQMICRPLLIHAKLPSSFWSHAVLHAAVLLKYRPTLLNERSPLEILTRHPPSVAHFRTFGCRVWVPVPEPERKTIGTHRQEGIYVGFDSPSIIRYVSPQTGILHKARFQNCQFEETVFPSLTSASPSQSLVFADVESFTKNPDPRTSLADLEVKKLLALQALAEKMPDGFSDSSRITRNPLPSAGQTPLKISPHRNKPQMLPQPKRPRASHHGEILITPELPSSEPFLCSPTETESVLSFVAELTSTSPDPLTLEAAKASPEWPHWFEALQHEYASLRKHQVFGPLVTNLPEKPLGHKLIFTKKRNAQGEVLRYKVRLVAQGFTQRPGVDYTFTYSPVMDSTTFRYLLGLAVQNSLETQLLDVVTAYLYGPLDANLYIKPPPDFLSQSIKPDSSKSFSGLKLQRALYGLRQAGRMWYSHLHSFLLSHQFQHDPSLPCIFTLRNSTGFAIVAIYVDDLNLVGTPATCNHVVTLLTKRFEMKLLGRTSYCLGLQVANLTDGSILLHQTTYTKKILKRFDMDQATLLSAPMIGRSRTQDDPYHPCEEEEEEFYDKTRYLAAVGAFFYLATFTRPDISFAISVLARHNQRPSIRHW